MPINVKISLCKITRSSKLFQRNYYLPLLKPLSPKDALRRKIITGQNVLGNRIEHYIPCLNTHEDRSNEKKKHVKGAPVVKKRVKMSSKIRYVAPFLDENMENHPYLMNLLARKGRGKGQHYTYEVLDKNCTLVLNYQMEKAIKDKDIIDVIMAQRSEKIVVKLKNDLRVTLPIAPYDGSGPLYRGGGWTREHIEEEHHHGKETMSIAKIFEAKEGGVDEWELEMMRLANKRKKKTKGGPAVDWKEMMQGAVDNMDWNKFEEDSKQIVEEIHEVVEEENIPMAVDDMEKTKNVADKLKQAGQAVLSQLPNPKQVNDVIKIMDQGDLAELANVSGAIVKMPDGKNCFVVGQMVKGDDSEVFVPGQTVAKEDGTFEYVPGITVFVDGEPTLIPGLVMGEEDTSAMFLPGESTITEDGQLKFEGTEADYNPDYREPSPDLPFDEVEPDEEEEEEEEEEEPTPKPAKKKNEPVVIRRRVIDEPKEQVKEKKVKKKKAAKATEEVKTEPAKAVKESFRPQIFSGEDPLMALSEKLHEEQEAEWKRLKEKMTTKIAEEEMKVDKLRITMYKKYKNIKFEKPKPFEPVKVEKSSKLLEMEENIMKGSFLEDDRTKAIMENVRSMSRMSRMQRASSSFGFSRVQAL